MKDMTQLNDQKQEFSELEKALPPIISRKEVPRFLGGAISLGHLQNLDSEGKGPKRFFLGKRVVYRRADLLAWLEANLREATEK
jgi:hypothetical protein